jgi:hypothetical protein
MHKRRGRRRASSPPCGTGSWAGALALGMAIRAAQGEGGSQGARSDNETRVSATVLVPSSVLCPEGSPYLEAVRRVITSPEGARVRWSFKDTDTLIEVRPPPAPLVKFVQTPMRTPGERILGGDGAS